jgi:hypothetical protein
VINSDNEKILTYWYQINVFYKLKIIIHNHLNKPWSIRGFDLSWKTCGLGKNWTICIKKSSSSLEEDDVEDSIIKCLKLL